MAFDYKELRKNVSKDYSTFPRVNIGILADSAAQYPSQTLRALAYEYGLDAAIYEAPFGNITEEAIDGASGLYEADPDYVIILPEANGIRRRYYDTEPDKRGDFAHAEAERLACAAASVNEKSAAPVIVCNYMEIDDGLFGSYAAAYPLSLLSVFRKINMLLADELSARAGLFISDIASAAAKHGIAHANDERMYYLSSSPFSREFLVVAMNRVMSVIAALRGRINKCLITDLDDTLWGGVIGEVGMENIALGELGIGKAYSDLQAWIKELSRRGIAICVCSKNEEAVAKAPFTFHPDMKLSMDDIAVFKANWADKAQNIKEIKSALNIGYDSMVFIDDNPAERDAVRKQLPDVTVPELPADPTGVLSFLIAENLFETVSLSGEDMARTDMYRQAGKREEAKSDAQGIEEYLEGLGMVCSINPFDSFSVPRIAQLTQRTNQFNLRTVRYSESDIQRMAEGGPYITMAVSLKDNYGDYGIIGAAILREDSDSSLFLDTWLISCRVAKKGVEEYVFNAIMEAARAIGKARVEAEFIPTAKNVPVKNLLADMGFAKEGEGEGAETGADTDAPSRWFIDVNSYVPARTFIRGK